jgi:hypothetical protein
MVGGLVGKVTPLVTVVVLVEVVEYDNQLLLGVMERLVKGLKVAVDISNQVLCMLPVVVVVLVGLVKMVVIPKVVMVDQEYCLILVVLHGIMLVVVVGLCLTPQHLVWVV